tara:strand:- start:453 stop:743 length:291 start_codon:yes stop_codon:yes gene_type:complete
MSQQKSISAKSYHEKTVLGRVLYFIENYLPQKKKKSSHSEFHLDKFESFTIKKIKKLASARSKSLDVNLSDTKVTLTLGNWTLPYLNLLKKIKFRK